MRINFSSSTGSHRSNIAERALGRIAAVLFTALVVSPAASSLAADARSGRHALLIGIGRYADPAIQELKGVPADMDSARRIAAAMDVPQENVEMLRDASATKAGILGRLEALASRIRRGDRVFVYYSGHGTRWYDPASQACVEGLLTHDRAVITNQEFATASARIRERSDKFISLFDACHSGGVLGRASAARSLVAEFVPKFQKLDGPVDCSRPSNFRTKGLLGESVRLGAIQENVVEITSSRPDEVSFDEPGKGGLATQGVRDCLLGGATDLNASGAVSLDEVEQCAQKFVNRRLEGYTHLAPHHVTVRGNRGLIPVAATRPVRQNVGPVALPNTPASVAAVPDRPSAQSGTGSTPPAQSPVVALPGGSTSQESHVAPVQATLPSTGTAQEPSERPPMQPTVASTTSPAAAIPGDRPITSEATLNDVYQQRDPRHRLDVTARQARVKIGSSDIGFTLRSNQGGYLYVVLLSSDRKSFYVLFPNGLDADNRIPANTTVVLPKPDWAISAAGPPGKDYLLFVVADGPRDLAALKAEPATSVAPFTYLLTDLGSRARIVNFLAGSGADAGGFGAALVRIEEFQ